MRAVVLLLLGSAIIAADWPVAGAVRRWTLAPVDPAAGGLGMVTLWPQSADETGAVVVAGTAPVPSTVVWRAPGQPLEVWFEASRKPTHVYLGRDLAAPAWEPPQGLILETRARPSGAIDTAERILGLWDRATKVYGRGAVERIFAGANPFGPTENVAARFSGWIDVPSAGAWEFATISADGSVLRIDGAQVVAWPGWHGPDEGRRGQHHGTVTLTAGRHHIDYRIAQGAGTFCAAVAWKPPGAKEWAMIPASAFASPTAWRASDPATPAGPDWAVTWATLGHVAPGPEADDPCLVRTRMELTGPAGKITWQGDDGGAGEGRTYDHAWLAPGLRSVTVALDRPGQPRASRSLTVDVHPAWTQAGTAPEGKSWTWRSELAGRDFATLPVGELAAALGLALAADEALLIDGLLAAVGRRLPDLIARDPALVLRLGLRIQNADLRKYARAITILDGVATGSGVPPALADRARLHLGGLRLALEGDVAGAAAAWQGITASRLNDEDRRLLGIYRADALALAGDAAGARAAYRALPRVADPDDRSYVLRRRLRLELARDRCSQGYYTEAEQALREIEWETPLERLGDETGLLFLRLWLAREEFARARTRARMLLAGEGGPREPEVLLAAARVEIAAKDPAAARRLIERLRKDHPYSEAAAQAAEMKL